jgi:predicted nucleotidyltransferase
MKESQIDLVVDQFRVRVRKVLGPALVAIYWFGSRVRGNFDESSDYDLLLELKDNITEAQRDVVADLAIDISSKFGAWLDIHYRTVERMSEPPYAFSPFVQSVISEGVLL